MIDLQVHVLPREILGKSTFELAGLLMKWFPLGVVDRMLLILGRLILGNLEKHGLKKPSIGPLQLKNTAGKTPVLDIGALKRIRSGEIKVVPGIKRFFNGGVELVNGDKFDIDSVILATGYRSNVPSWLKVSICLFFLIHFKIIKSILEVSMFQNPCDSYGSWFLFLGLFLFTSHIFNFALFFLPRKKIIETI